jgi:hypothetical protein
MDRLHQFIGFGRQDFKGIDRLIAVVLTVPSLPETGEGIYRVLRSPLELILMTGGR